MNYSNDIHSLLSEDVLARKNQKWNLHKIKGDVRRLIGGIDEEVRAALEIITKVAPDQIFLAGGSLVMPTSQYDSVNIPVTEPPKDLDFFVVGKTEEEASALVFRCLQVLGGNHSVTEGHYKNMIVTRSKTCVNVYYNIVPEYANVDASNFNNNGIYQTADFIDESLKIQFILRLYSDRSQIIGMFDLWPCQMMYSDKFGVEATSMGAFSHKEGCHYLDCTRISPSFSARIRKYARKGYLLCKPDGCKPDTTDYLFREFVNDNAFEWHGSSYWNDSCQIRQEDYDDGTGVYGVSTGMILFKNLYPHLELKESAQFLVKALDPSLPIDYDLSKEAIYRFTDCHLVNKNFKEFDMRHLPIIHSRCPDQAKRIYELFGEFSLSEQQKQDVWVGIRESLLEADKKLICSWLPPFNGKGIWKTANPGEQSAGSFNPKPISARDFWKSSESIYQAGVGHFEYWIIKQICKRYGLGRDIINYICYKLVELKAGY